MKETKIEIPAGCEVEKIETVNNSVLVTFKAKEPQLPKSWEEFCRQYAIKTGECRITTDGSIASSTCSVLRDSFFEKNVLPNRETAEAVLALCQLIQLRECYNQGWKPDWDDKSKKHLITFENDETVTRFWYGCAYSPLYFKSEELRDQFLENFRPLIEKLKPLYGIAL